MTFLHLQAIIVPCPRVNKLIFCTSSLTIGCKNCFMNELWFCSLNCQMLITKPNTHYYIVSVLQVSSVKKFIKNVNPHVVNFFFHLSFTAFLVSIWDVKRNYIHTFSWKSLLKRHFFPSYELHISLTQHRCALTQSEYAWLDFWGDWLIKLHSALWSFYSLTYINFRVKC